MWITFSAHVDYICPPIDPPIRALISRRRPTPSFPPPDSARTRAGGPEAPESCQLASAPQATDRADCGAHGGDRQLEAIEGSSGKAPDARAGLEGARGHQITEALQALQDDLMGER